MIISILFHIIGAKCKIDCNKRWIRRFLFQTYWVL